jgi:hypothetical protein
VFQFECKFPKKRIIGEWMPLSEPGSSDVIEGKLKWVWGIRWPDIDENLVLTVVDVKFDLKLAPMVMEELRHLEPGDGTPRLNSDAARKFG